MNFGKTLLDLLNQSTPASFPPLPRSVFNMHHTEERFYVKHFLILHFLLSCSGSNEKSSKTNPELFQPKVIQTYINALWWKALMYNGKYYKYFQPLKTNILLYKCKQFYFPVEYQRPKEGTSAIRTYPFFWKIQRWQVQSSGVGRFPVNWHHITIIISQGIPNPEEKNKGTKMQTSKQAATESAITMFLMIIYVFQ